MKRLAHRVCGPAILVGLLIMSLLCGCRHSSDPSLAAADSLMEEHPDSALMMLNEYPSGTPTSEADSAYYALLLTHARYKNFIDETDDSLISSATDYFLDHDDKGKASRALFLQGMIRMNANRLGEAAVSFRKGLDIARESKQYMWEGQCARGLCMLYGELYNGSAQVAYAKQSYDVFMKAGDDGWIEYAKLNLARAFNNNGLYKEADSVVSEIIATAKQNGKTEFMDEAYQLKGLTLYALGKYKESILNYYKAFKLNSTVLTSSDRRNINIASAEISQLSEIEDLSFPPDIVDIVTESSEPFVVLASKGQYKDAYKCLEQYKNEQDSALSLIFKNNVSESINQYEEMRNALAKEKARNDLMSSWLILLMILIVASIVIWRYREWSNKEKLLRIKTEHDMESLRSDLMNQLEKAKRESNNNVEFSSSEAFEDFIKIIRRHYAETNQFVDEYYQGKISKGEREKVEGQIQQLVKDLSNKDGLEKIRKYVDERSGGLYSSFKNDFFHLTEDDKKLFLYLILGFSPRTIAVIIGYGTPAVYNRKTRLKTRIEESDAPKKDLYLRVLQKNPN